MDIHLITKLYEIGGIIIMGYFDDDIDKKEEYLEHHGIRGQKWGIRRFQNTDGTLTAQGKSRYGDKIEKKLQGATKWENKAINAKTGIGRSLATSVAVNKRFKADKAADKATGDYKMLALNKNSSRALGSASETNARIAQGLKDKADKSSGKQKEKLMNQAIKHLATAENLETGAKAYKNIADAPALAKGGTFIRETIKVGFGNNYTSAGRKTSFKDRVLESIGNQVLDEAFNLGKNAAAGDNEIVRNTKLSVNTAVNTTGRLRDAAYKKGTTAEDRWNKIANR